MWGRVLLLCAVLSGLVVGGVMVAILMIDAHVKGRPATSSWVVPSVVAGAGVAAFTLVLGLLVHIFAKKSAKARCKDEKEAKDRQKALQQEVEDNEEAEAKAAETPQERARDQERRENVEKRQHINSIFGAMLKRTAATNEKKVNHEEWGKMWG
jgi:flagellar biosynthesis/type III secretory pathway M-ring protein FliF/YscJ